MSTKFTDALSKAVPILLTVASGKVTYTGLAIVAVAQALEMFGVVPVGSGNAASATVVGLAVALFGRLRKGK